jgi:hypothetical protein
LKIYKKIDGFYLQIFLNICKRTGLMSSVGQPEIKGLCAICGNSIPHIPGQKVIHYIECDCDENPIICPHCRRDTEYPRKKKVCHWCHREIWQVCHVPGQKRNKKSCLLNSGCL